jgi:hypothetical protein
MALLWVVKEVDGERQFFVQEASTQMYAALKSAMAGFDGKYVETQQLDAKTAKKLPKDPVGRVLKQREAMKVLKKLG